MTAPARAKLNSHISDFPRGLALLRDPLLNKGTAFTDAERDELGLRGFLPAHVLSMEEQVARVLTNLRSLPNDLEKYVALNSLHDRNEELFFRVVCDNIDEIQPLIYTPTVGLACQRFGLIFQRPRGMFISATDRGRIADLLAQLALPGEADRRHRRRAHPRARRSRAPTAWASRSASFRSTRPAPAFTPSIACRSCWMSAPTTQDLLNDPLLYRLAPEAAARRGL